MITEENFRTLQLLDLLKNIDFYSEVNKTLQLEIIKKHMQAYKIEFSDFDKYLQFYPNKVYKNMYEMGLTKGVLT